MLIMRKFPGTIGASRHPSSSRSAMRVGKLLAKPVPIKTQPHSTDAPNIVFAMGKRCRTPAEGKHPNI